MIYNRSKNNNKRQNKGFSLFELLIVISISAVIATISFAGFPKMNSKLSLDLLAQDIALSLRQAQVFGTTVMGVGANSEIADAYGVSFPNPDDESARIINGTSKDYRFVVFADLSSKLTNSLGYLSDNPNYNVYNEASDICMNDESKCVKNPPVSCGSPSFAAGIENECLQPYVVTGKDKITDICLNYMNSSTMGYNRITGKEWDKNARVDECRKEALIPKLIPGASIDIVYRRPKLKAIITTKMSSGDLWGSENGNMSADPLNRYINNFGIVVTSDDNGETRVVVAWANGQISIDK
ncbi:MAG: prepilin-type N-terminal cleavage/methylation domain-containing protein [bacterium]